MESTIVNLAVVDAVRLSGIDFGKQKTIDTYLRHRSCQNNSYVPCKT